VRLYRSSTPRPTFRQLGEQLGVHQEALRNWVRQAEADEGERDDRPTTTEVEELRRLRKEVAELRRANEILKAASALFARPRKRPVVPLSTIRCDIAMAAPGFELELAVKIQIAGSSLGRALSEDPGLCPGTVGRSGSAVDDRPRAAREVRRR
jgi:transposase